MAYEVQIEERRKEEEEEQIPKKKNIAFEATSDNESEDDEEMDMITRRFKMFMKNDKFFKRRFNTKKEIKCFKCKKQGHVMENCHLLKSKAK